MVRQGVPGPRRSMVKAVAGTPVVLVMCFQIVKRTVILRRWRPAVMRCRWGRKRVKIPVNADRNRCFHRPFSLPGGLVGVFRPVGAVLDRGHHLTVRGCIGTAPFRWW